MAFMKENGNGKPASLKLRIGELTGRDDFGRGIIRIDTKNMKKLGVKEGDILEIGSKKTTPVIAVRAYPADIGLDIVRVDGVVRRNCGNSIGDFVEIKKAEVSDAKSVAISPTKGRFREDIMEDIRNIMKQNLLMRPVKTGDIIIANPVVRMKRHDDFMGIENDPMMDMLKSMGFDVGMFGGNVPSLGEERFVVVSTNPKGIARITEDTEIELISEATKPMDEKMPEVTYEDIGGMKEEVQKVREMIELPLKRPELFEKLGIEPPKGVLLYGPPGTGKTLLAKAVANETGAHFFSINGPEIMSKFYGQSEENLRKVFEDAEKEAPSIIFIDEIDAIAPKREEVTGEVERRVVSQLLTLMDGLKSRGKIIVIAATNRVNAIDQALRRGGRFDREIEIGVPNKDGRKEIFQVHTRGMPLAKDVNLDKLSEMTYGYVGADISSLSKEAAMHVLRKVLGEVGEIKDDQPLSEELLKKLVVSQEDFEYAMKTVEPSAMREVMIEKPNVKWTDIGGLDVVKEELREAIEWPLKNPESFRRLGIRPPKGILLYGPPGCGKTLMAKAVASESESNFILVNGPELLSKWYGESEKKLREIFQKAKQVQPCIIFFDEIDSLTPRRGGSTHEASERIVSQLLTLMSGVEDLHDVFVLAATNRPDMIDPALLRPGRFDKQILIPSPDLEARKQIIRIHTKGMPLSKDVDLDEIAGSTDGYSGADMEAIAREAAMNAMRKDIKAGTVTKEDFDNAIKSIKPSITEKMNSAYRRIINSQKKVEPEELKEEVGYRA